MARSVLREQMRLMELHQLRMTLLEDRLDFLRKTFVPRFQEMQPQIANLPQYGRIERLPGGNFGDKLLTYILSFDPAPTKKNAKWLCALIGRKKEPMPLEDLTKAQAYLTTYEELKQARKIPKELANVEQFKTLQALFDVVKGAQDASAAASDAEQQKARNESTIFIDNDHYLVLSPRTKYAAGFWGRDTEWCTAYGCLGTRYPDKTDNMFKSYARRGPLYFILDKKNGEKFQFHFEDAQLMDADDRWIDQEAFARTHPELRDFFNAVQPHQGELGRVGGTIAHLVPHGEGARLLFFPAPDSVHVAHTYRSRSGAMSRSYVAQIILDANRRVVGADQLIRLTLAPGRPGYTNESPGFPFAEDFNISGDLRRILALAKVAGTNGAQPLAPLNLFWNGTAWGGIDKAPLILQYPKGAWHGYLNLPDGSSYATWMLAHFSGAALAVRHGELVIPTRRFPGGHIDAEFSSKLTDLLIKIKGDIEWAAGDHTLKPDDLTQADALRLVEHNPGAADMLLLFRAKGPADPAFRKKLLAFLGKHDVAVKVDDLFGDRIILNRYKDIQDLAEHNGGLHCEWFLKLLQGDEHLEYSGHVSADRYQLKELIESLGPDQLDKLIDYLNETYADEIADLGIELTDADTIMELQDEVRDNDLQRAAGWAIASGYEVGGQSEAFEIFKRQVLQYDYIFFKTEQGWANDELVWDVPAVLAPKITELIQYIEKDPEELDALRDSWMKAKEQLIDPDEPRSGFTDYDDDAAKERFAEDVPQRD